MNGAAGRRVYGFSSTDETVKAAPSRPSARARASASVSWTASAVRSFPSWAKSRPWATRRPSTDVRRAVKPPGSYVATMSQYSAATNLIRSRSRSTTSRVATDCTRPADRPCMIFRQSTGETS